MQAINDMDFFTKHVFKINYIVNNIIDFHVLMYTGINSFKIKIVKLQILNSKALKNNYRDYLKKKGSEKKLHSNQITQQIY